MTFYLSTSFIFPRSLRMRLFALCFVATHIPLLAYCGWGLATGRIAMAEFLVLIAATVVGMALALIGMGALLSPLHALAETLHQEAATQALPDTALPAVGDVIQTLYAGVHRAATAAQNQLQNLSVAAHEDPLTGIANRRGFLHHLGALPEGQRRGCVAIVDIDFFKSVNDQFGHEKGDRVLCAFAGRLSAQLRRMDVVARWGGEEFAIFFANCIEDEAAWALERIAGRMRDDPIAVAGGRAITFSGGLCSWAGCDLDTALRDADEALYCAKQTGRDRICRAMTTPMKA